MPYDDDRYDRGPAPRSGRAEPPDERDKKKRTMIIVGAVATVLALAAAGLAFGGVFGDDSSAGEVILTAADSVGPDPYSATPLAPPPSPAPAPLAATSATVTAAPGTAIAASSGAKPGLYGGTMNHTTCDPAQMVQFLAQNPAKAAAWVESLNRDPSVALPDGSPLTTANIPAYVASLTSVVLTADTRVTNHGFKNNKATTMQSVLQKGSAVLVDKFGVPRAKCYCGNPLTPAVPTKVRPVYTGRAWVDFDPAAISAVQKSPTIINVFVLKDLASGRLFDRPAGTMGANDAPNNGATSPTTVVPTSAPVTAVSSTVTPSTAPRTTVPQTTAAPTTAPQTTAPETTVPSNCSPSTNNTAVDIDITNKRGETIVVYWVDFSCKEVEMFKLQPGETKPLTTTVGHVFRLRSEAGTPITYHTIDGAAPWVIT